MKYFLLLPALFIFSTSFATSYNSIFLSDEVTRDLQSIESLITVSPLSTRDIAGSRYWINPFRNIQRSLRSIDEGKAPKYTLYRINKFIDSALEELNTKGTIAIYGNEVQLGYFLRDKTFYLGGIK